MTAIALTLGTPALGQPADPPVELLTEFEAFCQGDFFNDPQAKCFPLDWLDTYTRLSLNTFIVCPTMGIEDYDGIDNFRSSLNRLAVSDTGETGTGLVNTQLVNTAQGAITIEYPAARGTPTDVVAELHLFAELTSTNLGPPPQACPMNDQTRDYTDSVQLVGVLEIDQTVRLTDRVGDFDVLGQFSIGDLVPPGLYPFVTETANAGSGDDSPDVVVIEQGFLAFTMPDCDGNGVSDFDQIDTDANGTPDGCEQVQNVTQGTGWASLQGAVNAANDFDEILIRAGTLEQSGTFVSKPLTIRGEGKDVSIIDAGYVDRCLFIADTGPGMVIEDITFLRGDSFVEGELAGNVLVGNNAQVAFDRCAFRDGRSTNGNGGGLAVFGDTTSVSLNECDFTGNQATFDGGAVILYNQVQAFLTDCTFANNSAGFSGGAALLFDQSFAFFDRCVLEDNSASAGGALAQGGSSIIDMRQCAFRRNIASGGGAAQFAFGSNFFQATNTLFADGIAQGGAALQLQGTADARLINCTVAGNQAFNTLTLAGPDNQLVAFNCIFAGNSGLNGPDSLTAGSVIERCIFPEAFGTSIAFDPLFVDAAGGDYRILASSPAIEAGDPAASPQDAADLDQNPRVADDAGIPGFAVDIGAYEFQGASCLPDTNGDGVLNPADFSAWIIVFNGNSALADQNRDGVNTPADFSAWILNYNAGC